MTFNEFNNLSEDERSKELIKRFESLLWQLGHFLVWLILSYITDAISIAEFNPIAAGILAKCTAEYTKFLNKK